MKRKVFRFGVVVSWFFSLSLNFGGGKEEKKESVLVWAR
jgi:hypothetical protein